MLGSILCCGRWWAVPTLLMCASASAGIITVPGDYPSIQAGINAAQDGDEVVVSPGTYFENISFVGRDITVRSTGPFDPDVVDATIIDGQFFGRCVLMDRGMLSGFTIRNGIAGNGGGVYLQHLGPDAEISYNVLTDCIAQIGGGIRAGGGLTGAVRIVRNNVVQNNEAWAGAGIAAGSVLVENNLICFNETDFFKYAHGGGISAGSSAVVRGNVIVGNISWDLGGGVNAQGHSTIEDNLIADNSSFGSGGGVYIDILGYDVVVRNNTIISNSAMGSSSSDWSGGGVKIAGVGAVIGNIIAGNDVSGFAGDGGGVAGFWTGSIIGNLIVGNSATGPGGGASATRSSLIGNTIAGNTTGEPDARGGGVALAAATSGVVVVGNIIAHATAGTGLYIYPEHEPEVVDYNCIFGNAGGDYGGAAQPGAHDVNADPLFTLNPNPGPDGEWGTDDDDYGDLHLLPGSPCIDAGDNSAVPADETDLDNDGDTKEPIPFDLDGNPRFVDDPNTDDTGFGDPPIVDIGAYEFQDPCADDDGDGRVTICHIPPGNPGNAHTIIVRETALPAHLAHGDHCGPCSAEPLASELRCPADLDGSGAVSAADLATLLGSWGPCAECPADLDGDGQVAPFDLALLLGAWGECD